MARLSKIDKLAQELRDKVIAWRAEGLTIDAIQARLLSEPLPKGSLPVRSGIGEFVRKIDAMIADAVKSRAIALALGHAAAEESPQAAYNIELLHNDVLELLTRRREENAEPLAPLELVRLSTAVARLVAAQAKAAEGAAKPAAEPEAAAADAPREKGLSAERVAELQEKVAGVHVERERQPE